MQYFGLWTTRSVRSSLYQMLQPTHQRPLYQLHIIRQRQRKKYRVILKTCRLRCTERTMSIDRAPAWFKVIPSNWLKKTAGQAICFTVGLLTVSQSITHLRRTISASTERSCSSGVESWSSWSRDIQRWSSYTHSPAGPHLDKGRVCLQSRYA